MSFDINFNKNPIIAAHGYCCRCETPTENSPVGAGRVPTGPKGALEDIKNIIVCISCLELMQTDPKTFWHQGWPNHPKKK